MSDWQATHRVTVTVTFAHGDTLEGEAHLQPSTALHQGAETPLEMLNRPDQFFAMTLPSGTVALVSKAQTAVVTCREILKAEDAERVSVAKELRLQIHLVGGQRFEGIARTELPPLHSRTVDFLNNEIGFLDLADGDTIHLINRPMIQHVHPID